MRNNAGELKLFAYQFSNMLIVFFGLYVACASHNEKTRESLINIEMNCNLTQVLVTPQSTTIVAPEFPVIICRKVFLFSFRSVLSKEGVFYTCSEQAMT